MTRQALTRPPPGIERPRLGEGHHAAAEAAAGDAGAVDPGRRDEPVDQLVDLGCRGLEVVHQAAVALGHDRPGCPEVVASEGFGEGVHPPALGDDVPGAAAQHRVHDPRHVRLLGLAEREPELVGGGRALGPPGAVGGPDELSVLAGVDDHHLGVPGHADLLEPEVREVDQHGVPSLGAGHDHRVHQPDVDAHRGLSSLAQPGEDRRWRLHPERHGQRH